MKNNRLPRNLGAYLLLGLLFIVVLLLVPRKARFNYEYEKGAPWMHETLTAQFDFPILKTATQLEEDKEAADGAKPCFRFDDDIVRKVLVEAENLALPAEEKGRVLGILSNIYSRGVVDSSDLPADADVVLIRKNKHYSESVSSEIFTVISARNYLFGGMFYAGPTSANVDSLLENSGAYKIIRPNLKRDLEGEQLLKSYKGDDVSKTRGYVTAGQVIVNEGEIISSDTYQILESYRAEFSQSVGYSGSRLLFWAGNAIFALLFCVLVFLSILYCAPEVFDNRSRMSYLIIVMSMVLVGIFIPGRISPDTLYLIPFTLFCLYLQPYLNKALISLLYCIVLLPLPVFCNGGIEVFFIYLVAGMVTIFIFDRITKSWHQFVMSLGVFACMFVTFLAFRLIDGTFDSMSVKKISFLLFGAFLPVAGYPLIFLFEKIFSLVSPSRLEELADPNNRLLQELSMKAPGTFQHCLAVMNMADAAARSINADVPLVRAGAMYHDIGKMANPQCFIENEALGDLYHNGLTPLQSASEILRHVPDGLEMAQKNKLPKEVCDFIVTHHGVSCTGYFYNKFLNEGGDPAQKQSFTYKGRKPQTKEQAILMLCDTIEAASRTLKDNKPETFDLFVEKMVKSKLDDGQLDECNLSLKELVTLKSVLKDYLGRLYHARVVYPGRK